MKKSQNIRIPEPLLIEFAEESLSLNQDDRNNSKNLNYSFHVSKSLASILEQPEVSSKQRSHAVDPRDVIADLNKQLQIKEYYLDNLFRFVSEILSCYRLF